MEKKGKNINRISRRRHRTALQVESKEETEQKMKEVAEMEKKRKDQKEEEQEEKEEENKYRNEDAEEEESEEENYPMTETIAEMEILELMYDYIFHEWRETHATRDWDIDDLLDAFPYFLHFQGFKDKPVLKEKFEEHCEICVD
jgi:flagellar biosynthesis GTPase FlhF